MSKPKVFIIYGFSEGPWHGRLFLEELKKRGFALANSIQAADIIIAHSAGCFYLPKARSKQLTVLINSPYWPDKSLIHSGLESAVHNFAVLLRADVPTGFWLQKTAWNALYLWLSLRKAFLMAVHARRRKFELALVKRRVLLIRSQHDPWLSPDAGNLLNHTGLVFKKAPGWHDHCWLYPQKYVEMIKSVYES